jgi:CheY-like chemotaxis protein
LRREVDSAPVGKADAMSDLTILLVDDDNAVREVTRAILEELGYRVTEAGSGGAALDVIERNSRIDLLIADFAMPGMNGAELARLARAKRPALPVLFVTGFAQRTALASIGDAQIISKPFVERELVDKIRVALGSRTSSDTIIRLETR